MSETRECPLCGGAMRRRQTERVTHFPGNPQPTVQKSSEWNCPECDYYEEAEEEST